MDRPQEPRASFVLCTRNRAGLLDRALDNARNFITARDELHIIDGVSTDNTAQVVERYRDIVTTFESVKSGVSQAYNMAFLKAKGRILINLTDDDYFFPEGVTRAIETMEAHPEIDALVCGGVYSRYDEATGEPKDWGYQYLPPGQSLASDIKHLVTSTTAGFLILNRRMISRVGLLDTTIQANDTDYMSRLLLCGATFRYLNVKMFRHIEYKHSGQLNWQQSNIDLIRVLVRHGEWNHLLRFRWKEIATALGLDPGADASVFKTLARVTLKAVFHAVNNGAVRAMEQSIRLYRDPRALARKVAHRLVPAAGAQPSSQITEPVWDGSLR